MAWVRVRAMDIPFYKDEREALVKQTGINTSPPQTGFGWEGASFLGFLGEKQKQAFSTSHHGSHG